MTEGINKPSFFYVYRQRRKNMSLEDYGALTEPADENAVNYDLRALDKHCKDNKILPTDLSPEELKQFEIPKDRK